MAANYIGSERYFLFKEKEVANTKSENTFQKILDSSRCLIRTQRLEFIFALEAHFSNVEYYRIQAKDEQFRFVSWTILCAYSVFNHKFQGM